MRRYLLLSLFNFMVTVTNFIKCIKIYNLSLIINIGLNMHYVILHSKNGFQILKIN